VAEFISFPEEEEASFLRSLSAANRISKPGGLKTCVRPEYFLKKIKEKKKNKIKEKKKRKEKKGKKKKEKKKRKKKRTEKKKKKRKEKKKKRNKNKRKKGEFRAGLYPPGIESRNTTLRAMNGFIKLKKASFPPSFTAPCVLAHTGSRARNNGCARVACVQS
jgi:superfamily II DNA/RNA helicase